MMTWPRFRAANATSIGMNPSMFILALLECGCVVRISVLLLLLLLFSPCCVNIYKNDVCNKRIMSEQQQKKKMKWPHNKKNRKRPLSFRTVFLVMKIDWCDCVCHCFLISWLRVWNNLYRKPFKKSAFCVPYGNRSNIIHLYLCVASVFCSQFQIIFYANSRYLNASEMCLYFTCITKTICTYSINVIFNNLNTYFTIFHGEKKTCFLLFFLIFVAPVRDKWAKKREFLSRLSWTIYENVGMFCFGFKKYNT